jgi:hypothetical protein
MRRVRFIFGIHNHQPVGNFQSVFEEAFDKSYYPFLQLVEKYPAIRPSIHFSGILLKWIQDNRPQGIDILKRLVSNRQLEVLTGGFYEPILPVIPDRDKLGQIKKLTNYVKNIIGDAPTGMWLAERVWEPHLPKILKRAGIEYTVLDDAHFKYSGLSDDQLYGYYLTEEQGDTVALFPISRKLRYTIPFRPVEETLEHLGNLAERNDDSLAIYADDGEKFGVWPGTYKSCFTEKWLERFFRAVSENSDWIDMLHFREALSSVPPVGRVYLPTASYTEMNEWALPAEAIERYDEFTGKLRQCKLDTEYNAFVRGGFWRNFLAKYAEVNNMHKKMLAVSGRIEQIKVQNPEITSELDDSQDYLWRAQCNCPYWHGVFGGLYLPHIRSAVYQNLIMAEKSIEGIIHNQPRWIEMRENDFDRDGNDELIVETPNANYYFNPSSGASLFELDYKPSNVNVVDTITRTREGYHHKIGMKTQPDAGSDAVSIHDTFRSKEEGLDKLLAYDWYRRGSFIDHFLGTGVTLEEFSASRYQEDGDFVNQPYQVEKRTVAGDAVVTFRRNGGVWFEGRQQKISIEKSFVLLSSSSEIRVKYVVTNQDKSSINLNFGIEFNFGFPSITSNNVNYSIDGKIPASFKRTDRESTLEGISRFGLNNGDDNFSLDCLLQKKAALWRFPVYSISLSEDGVEKVQQGICMLPSWRFHLSPSENWMLEIKFKLKELDPAHAKRAATVSLARA